ncbi:MAG: aminotransferase class I/II-fold pyridoxal phosphate-dependent enzyme [Bacteroidota bacterium]
MVDLFDKIRNSRGALQQFQNADTDGYFFFPELEGEIGSRMMFQGKERIVWSVNSYLGLANHPEVREIDAKASEEYGLAYPMGSRMMTGQTSKHAELEQKLSTFMGKEKSFVLNFGYQGIMSIVDALLDRKDVVVYDKDCHACIYDGIRMHLGKRLPFEHNDMTSFAKQIARAEKEAEKSGGGILVISEGVFGMRGQQGKLKEIVEFKKDYNFRLLIDDAHGFGTLGETGAGVAEAQGVQDDVDVYFSTFAKSMASIGAFVSADKDIIDYLRYTMRSQIFAKSLPMPIVVGNLRRLEMLQNMPELREKLWRNVNMIQNGLRERGFNIGQTNSCVTPVFMEGNPPEAAELVRDLRERYNIFCSVVVYPVVPKGTILLRLIPTAAHTEKDIQETLDAFSAIRDNLVSGHYREAALNKKEWVESNVEI